jgi:hypothetical protein
MQDKMMSPPTDESHHETLIKFSVEGILKHYGQRSLTNTPRDALSDTQSAHPQLPTDHGNIRDDNVFSHSSTRPTETCLASPHHSG